MKALSDTFRAAGRLVRRLTSGREIKMTRGAYWFRRRHVDWRSHLFLVAGVFAMVPPFFVSRAVFIGLAQTKDERQKHIGKASYPNEPVDIIDVSEAGERHSIGEAFFRNSGEWLQDFSMKIKNNSHKRIVYFAWQLEFPETATTGNVIAFQAAYGPGRFRKPADYENESPIAAGDAFEVGLTAKKFEQLKAFVGKRHSLQSLTKVDIRILDIHYDDGTGWSAGLPTKLDPQNPDRYIPAVP